ncbi:hypothetical protein DAT561_p1071 (plasmid) [Melissococcus plutonius]|uniref:Uncharacterized protein n=1 Tax=Melissococcus plutonius TaxID=33970 RepID=A0A2Z5Y4U9_9ENTE|nr:hypothetical protein DAT561_p1071 [Melissococcus plutonius]
MTNRKDEVAELSLSVFIRYNPIDIAEIGELYKNRMLFSLHTLDEEVDLN